MTCRSSAMRADDPSVPSSGVSTIERSRPSLEVGDLGAALAFLTDVVGFTAHVVEGQPPLFAIIGEGPSEIALVEVDEPAIPDGAACYVTLTGIDGLIERLAAVGIALAGPL